MEGILLTEEKRELGTASSEGIYFRTEVEVTPPEPGERPRTGENFEIRPLGDAASTDRPVFISRGVLEEAVVFARRDLAREQGGFLVGGRFVDGEGEFIWIDRFIEGEGIEGSPSFARFTSDSFQGAWRRIEAEGPRHYPSLLLGWFHTHPGFGAFLSEADRFIHSSFFDLPFLVAMVADPVREELKLYRWRTGEIRSTGFFLVAEKPSPAGEG